MIVTESSKLAHVFPSRPILCPGIKAESIMSKYTHLCLNSRRPRNPRGCSSVHLLEQSSFPPHAITYPCTCCTWHTLRSNTSTSEVIPIPGRTGDDPVLLADQRNKEGSWRAQSRQTWKTLLLGTLEHFFLYPYIVWGIIASFQAWDLRWNFTAKSGDQRPQFPSVPFWIMT